MVADISLLNLKRSTSEDRAKGAAVTNVIRANPILQMREAQAVLYRIITGAVRHHNGEDVIDIPAREIASAAVAFTKLEDRIRMNRGLANPAPIKSDSKRSKRSSAQVRIEPTPAPTEPANPVPTS